MKHVQSAGIITWRSINDSIYYLILQYGAGHWEFPKGKIESGETLQQAAHRELFEETGLHAQLDPNFSDDFSYIFTDHDGQVVTKNVIFFVGQADSDVVHLSDEHRNYVWLPFDRAYQKVTFTNARNMLQKANKWIINHRTAKQ